MGKLIQLEKRKILVTGISGFKGNWLAVMLHELGAEVYGYSRGPEHITSLSLEELDQVCTFQKGDIRNRNLFEQFVDKIQPKVIIHMAAQPLVRQSYNDPYETFETNIIGTLNVIETVRKHDKIKALLFVSSDKCYTNREWQWGYRENDLLGGFDPYSVSKVCGELINASYGVSFFMDRAFGSARAGNVIGGGDWSMDRIVPDCIKAITKGTPFVLRNPQATRPWQHVLDAIYGYILLIEKMLYRMTNGPYNFGPPADHIITVKELSQRIIDIWGEGNIILSEPHVVPMEAGKLYLDSSKAQFDLGWRCQVAISDAIEMTVSWYKAYFNGTKALDLIQQQTKTYLTRYRSLH